MRWGNVPPSGRSECGLVSLYLILQRHGIDKPLRLLRQEYPVGRDGMSSRNLRHALLDHGIPTEQKRGSIAECRSDCCMSNTAVIGFLDGDHFILFEKIAADGSARIVDPSEGSKVLDSEEVLLRWGGIWWTLPDPGSKAFVARSRLAVSRLKRSPTLGFALDSLRSNGALVCGLFAASLIVLFLSAVVPIITRELINNLVGSTQQLRSTDLALAFAIGIGVYACVFFGRSLFESKLNLRVSQVLKTEGFSRLLTATYSSVQKTSPGELIYCLNAATVVSAGLTTMTTSIIFNALLIGVLLLGVSLVWPSAALAMFLCIVLLLPFYALISSQIGKESSQQVSADSKGTSEQLQAILSFAALKMASAEPYVMARWQRFNTRGLRHSYRAQRWQGLLSTVSAILTIGSPLIPLVWAVTGPNSIDLGSLVAAGGVGSIIVSSITQIFSSSASLAQLAPSAQRLDEIMWIPQDHRGSQVLPKSKRKMGIEVDGLVVGYDTTQTPVLEDVSFRVPPGGIAVLQGPSGGGKSTLIRCLAGLMDPLAGSIRVEDVSIRDMTSSSRAECIGFVPQETYLFSGTLRDAILVGRQYTDEDVWHTLDLVCMTDEVKKMPMQLSTPVGDMGLTLSGGQRQRLALARAIIGQPKVLLLDEATSAVDVATEQSIIRNLLGRDFTIVAAAHRPAMIEEADTVITVTGNRAKLNVRKEK